MRTKCHRGAEAKRLTWPRLSQLELGLPDRIELVLGNGIFEGLGSELRGDLGTDLLAEALLEQLARHLALAEAGQLDLPAQLFLREPWSVAVAGVLDQEMPVTPVLMKTDISS